MTDTNGKTITIRRQFNPKSGNIDFFTDIETGVDPALVAALAGVPPVNLSRGHNRLYRLTMLSQHNGTGACWTDGREIHTAARQDAYVARCERDINAALAAAGKAYAKAIEARRFDTTPVVVATLSA
jgi:hypothetical protein